MSTKTKEKKEKMEVLLHLVKSRADEMMEARMALQKAQEKVAQARTELSLVMKEYREAKQELLNELEEQTDTSPTE